MERRKFVVGLGALAAGSSAAVGTGAFSAALIDDRDVDIEVVGDDAALIQLVPGYDEVENSTVSGDRVFHDDDEKLAISFDDDEGGDGINPSSTYQVGAIDDDVVAATASQAEQSDLINNWEDTVLYGPADPALGRPDETDLVDDPAFVMRNETNTSYRFRMSYDGDPQGDSDVVVVGARDDGGAEETFLFSAQGLGAGSTQNIVFPSGGKYSFSLLAIAGDDADGDHFDGSIRLEITEDSL